MYGLERELFLMDAFDLIRINSRQSFQNGTKVATTCWISAFLFLLLCVPDAAICLQRPCIYLSFKILVTSKLQVGIIIIVDLYNLL